MSKFLKWIAILAFSVVMLLGVLLIVLWAKFPRDIPVQQLSVGSDPQHVERGRYLVENVAFCWDCHGRRDWDLYSGPAIKGTEGQGGSTTLFGDDGAFGRNITPFALGDWTDGEIKRAITTGIAQDGQPIHPQMPYFTFRHMKETDLSAVIAYLRSLPPIAHEPPPSEMSFLIKLVARVMPKPYVAPEPSATNDAVARGAYLVRLAECRACHLPSFRGGFPLTLPNGSQLKSGDLLAHVSQTDRDSFIDSFKSKLEPRPLRVGETNTPMPWQHYAGLTESDLGDIYEFLRSRE